MVTCTINGEQYELMADTGASVSSINIPLPLSSQTLTIVGYSGKPQIQRFTQPLAVHFGPQ